MYAPGAQTVEPPARAVVGELVLERWRQRDLESLFSAISASLDHLLPWMPWAAQHERDSVAQFLSESEAGWERGDRFEYSIRDQQNDVLGSAGLMGRIGPGGLEIGYWIHVAHTRKGIATLAAALLTELALTLSTVDRVEIHHDEANIASAAIPARLGYRNIGTFPAKPKSPGDVGRDVRWRLDTDQFATSPARSLLEDARDRHAQALARHRAS
jgi:RimJ/RimL family protein N-acetyltransferase